MLRRLGLTDITVDYVVVDPLRVPRETFAAIWAAWRDGYADTISANTSISREVFLAQFDDMIATLEDPSGYGGPSRRARAGRSSASIGSIQNGCTRLATASPRS